MWKFLILHSSMQHCFPDSEAVFSDHGISDAEVRRKKPIKIFNFWMNNTKFTRLLHGSWSQEIVGSPMLRLNLKLKRLKPKALNKE